MGVPSCQWRTAIGSYAGFGWWCEEYDGDAYCDGGGRGGGKLGEGDDRGGGT